MMSHRKYGRLIVVVIIIWFTILLFKNDSLDYLDEPEWWDPKPFKPQDGASSGVPCPPLDPKIEEQFVGFPQNLTYGGHVRETGRPFLTHDFWAHIVDNRRTFLLRSFEEGFPSDESLTKWIRSRPHQITLIIFNNLDQSWPNEDGLLNKTSYEVILNETNVHAVYANNARYLKEHPKLQPLPLGLKWAFSSTRLFGEPKNKMHRKYERYGASSPAKSQALFQSYRRSSTVYWRPMKPTNAGTTKYVRDTPALQTKRGSIIPIVKQTAPKSMVFAPGQMDQETYLGVLKKHRFIISPPGNGLDTHATWEALLCGCIPIVPHSDLDRVFEDLPVWLVDSWEEVTDAAVKEKEKYFLGKQWNWEKIYQPYWRARIHEGLCTI